MTVDVAWLLAQIADDEQVARACHESEWQDDGACVISGHPMNEIVDYAKGDAAPHIARWDPKRVLDECEAKRRIIAEFEKALVQSKELRGTPHSTEAAARLLTLLGVIRTLTLPYADRPGYQEAAT